MKVFYVDLDNTLIYSYKHDIGRDKIPVERYQGREISFITAKTFNLLSELKKQVLLVPTTTRTEEQYKRITLGIGNLKYALVCNGGLLLTEGRSEKAWYEQSLQMVEPARQELLKAIEYLKREENRISKVCDICKLFVFTKCRFPEIVIGRLKELLNCELVDVFHNGEKVYVVPVKLNKGTAVCRFREYIGAEKILAAGDSIFDLPMLEQADLAAAPSQYQECNDRQGVSGSQIHIMPGKAVFSEELLQFMLKHVAI